jgi:hypothetical protein
MVAVLWRRLRLLVLLCLCMDAANGLTRRWSERRNRRMALLEMIFTLPLQPMLASSAVARLVNVRRSATQ